MQVKGNIRLDKRTKDLAKRLKPKDIAVIDHEDIDSVAAQMLVDAGVSIVINAAKSTSGKYPNLGPRTLFDAGVTVIDNAGPDLFDKLKEGMAVEVIENEITHNGNIIATGTVLTDELINQMLEDAKHNLSDELEKFAKNTLEYVLQEKTILVDPTNLPDVGNLFYNRHALVVVRGEGYRKDLAAIRTYIKDVKPVLIGVDGGADAIIELGLKPDIIIGDMDSVSDSTLKCGAKLIVHAYTDGKAPGLARIEELGLDATVCAVAGTSEDLALLLAYEKGAELIVAVGTHSHMIDFLDKGRKGMSSTFLARLKVGNRLVDAKGVRHLYRVSPSSKHLAVLALAAVVALVTVIAFSPAMQDRIQDIIYDFKSRFWHVWIQLRMWEK